MNQHINEKLSFIQFLVKAGENVTGSLRKQAQSLLSKKTPVGKSLYQF